MVKYIKEYFIDKTPPVELDFNYINEFTGENCALIACKSGNLELIKYLYLNTDSNFHIISKRDEGAI